MTQLINVSLIGYGYWGPNLARNLHNLPTCHLAAICDKDAGRLMEVERLYPTAHLVKKYREILIDSAISAVVIATPVPTHYSLTKEALQADKHVLVEKPITMDSTQAEELIEIAASKNKILMVGHTFEYNPAVHKIKELITTGQMGDLYYIYSIRANLGHVQKDLNALWSIAPHDISIIIYLLETLPLEISARGATCLNSGVEDLVFVNLSFPNNITAQIHVSWLDPSKIRKMTIVGSKKMVVYDDVDNEAKIKVYDKGVYKKGDDIYGEFQYKLRTGDIYIPKIDMTEPLKNECAHFIECILEGSNPLTDGESGLGVVRVLEAAQKSLENRGIPVEIDQ